MIHGGRGSRPCKEFASSLRSLPCRSAPVQIVELLVRPQALPNHTQASTPAFTPATPRCRRGCDRALRTSGSAITCRRRVIEIHRGWENGRRLPRWAGAWRFCTLVSRPLMAFRNVVVPPVLDRQAPFNVTSLPRARAGIMVTPTAKEIQSAAVTCSRTLLTTEQGTTDTIDAVTKAASEGFPSGTVIFLDSSIWM